MNKMEKTSGGIFIEVEDNPTTFIGCCTEHNIPTDYTNICEDYEFKGHGILMHCCSNCTKYKREE